MREVSGGVGGEGRGVAVKRSSLVVRVSPDLLDAFRRAGHAYVPVSELPSTPSHGPDRRAAPGGDGVLSGPGAPEGFSRSGELVCALAGWLSGEQARGLEHAQLEARLEADGRELIRALLQDHLDLRAGSERRLELVVGAERGAPCERRACASASARDGVRRGRGQAARVSHARR